MTVTVAIPILNMMLLYPAPHASVTVLFQMGVSMEAGTNVTLFFDFGDPTPGVSVTSMPRKGKFDIYCEGARSVRNKLYTVGFVTG